MSAEQNPTLSSEQMTRLIAVKRSARWLRQATSASKNQVLEKLHGLISEKQDAILKANQADLENLSNSGKNVTEAFKDRLKLSPERLKQMQESLEVVRSLPDPVGQVESEKKLPNGLILKQVRAPLGVILMIFEARPNVITEAFSLAIKSGNAMILRGGSESLQTSCVLYALIEEAIQSAGLPVDVFWGITDPSRDLSQSLMKQNKWIDVLVPRGGDRLIEYVTHHSTIPIIKNDRGLCHVYIHEDAEDKMAIDIVVNAKTHRPGVCNAMETLLVHQSKAHLLPQIYDKMKPHGVEWFGCGDSVNALVGRPLVHLAKPENFDTEYLDYKINCRIVPSLEEALEHIERHSSRHSECIVTSDETKARFFQNSIDAAVVYWNASTRFTDGYQFGLGGELGISTQKLHVRGPVGLKELTSLRWIGDGQGQIRQ